LPGLRLRHPIHGFLDRFPMLHREGFTGKKIDQNATDFIGLVWERGYRDDPHQSARA
jgi:hypothetical protein